MKEKCYNHSERNALSSCHLCGRYFCSECLTEGSEYYYCHSDQCQVALQIELKKIEESKPAIPYAPTGRRFANYIIDIVIFRVAMIILFIPFVNTDFVQDLARSEGADWLFGICLLFFYYFVFESVFQRTPAKFISGTKVIMQDGSKPSAVTIAKRTLSRFVPFEPLSGSKGTWWHDRWTKTVVIEKNKDVTNEVISTISEQMEITCPYCNVELELEEDDRRKGHFNCPSCNKLIVLNSKQMIANQ